MENGLLHYWFVSNILSQTLFEAFIFVSTLPSSVVSTATDVIRKCGQHEVPIQDTVCY